MLYEQGQGWIRGGFENGTGTTVEYDAATNNLRVNATPPTPQFTDAQRKKLLEIDDAFDTGGWANSATVQVSTTIKLGSTPHTASEITGLTYAASRMNPSPSTAQGHIGVRVPIAEQAKGDDSKLRVVQLSGDGSLGRSAELSASNRITTNAQYAFYSVEFEEFVSDETTRVEELDPFELDDRYLDGQLVPSGGTSGQLLSRSGTDALAFVDAPSGGGGAAVTSLGSIASLTSTLTALSNSVALPANATLVFIRRSDRNDAYVIPAADIRALTANSAGLPAAFGGQIVVFDNALTIQRTSANHLLAYTGSPTTFAGGATFWSI